MKIKDDFKVIPRFENYSINSQGVCKVNSTGDFIKPSPCPSGSGNYRYRLHNKKRTQDFRVHVLMLKRWGIDKEYKKKWFDFLTKVTGDEFLSQWNKVPETMYEITRKCSLRVVGSTKITSPTRNKSEHYYSYKIYNKKSGARKCLAVNPLFKAAFGYDCPEKYKKKYTKSKAEKPGPKKKLVFNCPYAENKIQPLYGPMGAEFSPLDWYHQQLPEAVMVGVK